MYQTIRNNILQFFHMYYEQAAIFAISVLAAGIVLRAIVCKCRKQKNSHISWEKWLLFALLSFYIYMVWGITLHSRSETYTSYVNLELFSTFRDDFMSRMYVYENILLFIPYAVLLYAWANPFRKWYWSLLTGIASSVLIEVMQYITHWGQSEIDDVFTNTLGMVIGFLVCKIIHMPFSVIKNKIAAY